MRFHDSMGRTDAIYRKRIAMTITRKEAKELLAEYNKIFAPILNKPCTLTWGTFEFETTPLSLDIAKTTGRKNIPEKRENGEKNSTPLLFVILTDSGELLFAFDDVQVTAIYNGARIIIPLDNAVGEAQTIELDMRLIV